MNIQVEVDECEVVAEAMLELIKDIDEESWPHKEDKKYNRKIRKAAVRIFKHYTITDRWSEVE